MINPWWDDDPMPPEFAELAEAVRTEAAEAAALYLDTGQPLAGHPEMVKGDGVHPNDQGHAAVAAAVDRALS